MTPLVVRVACCALAAYRIGRAVAVDSITLGFRKRIYKLAYPDGSQDGHGTILHPWDWLYNLISCPHCVGFWATLAIWLVWGQGHFWALLVAVLAAAGVQSFLASKAGPG